MVHSSNYARNVKSISGCLCTENIYWTENMVVVGFLHGEWSWGAFCINVYNAFLLSSFELVPVRQTCCFASIARASVLGCLCNMTSFQHFFGECQCLCPRAAFTVGCRPCWWVVPLLGRSLSSKVIPQLRQSIVDGYHFCKATNIVWRLSTL